MSPSEDGTTAPLDFTIETPENLRAILDQYFTRKSGYAPTRSMRMALRLLAGLQIGSLKLILPNNKTMHFNGKQDGPSGVLHIHNDRTARRFLTGGKLGFCESYLDGDWSSPSWLWLGRICRICGAQYRMLNDMYHRIAGTA